jgi:hypothetical protein
MRTSSSAASRPSCSRLDDCGLPHVLRRGTCFNVRVNPIATVARLMNAVRRGGGYAAPNGPHHTGECPGGVLRKLIEEDGAPERVIRIRNTRFIGDINLSHLEWRGTIDLDGCTVRGDLDLSHAKLDGRLSLSGTTLEMLLLAYTEINGPFIGTGLIAKRGVYALRARITGGVALQEADISAPREDAMRNRAALEMYHADIGDLYLNRATLRGGFSAVGMNVGRNIRLQGANIFSRSSIGLKQGADAGEGIDLSGSSIGSSLYLAGTAGDVHMNSGTIRLTNAKCRNFRVTDDELLYLRLAIDGFTYATLSPATGERLLEMLDREDKIPLAAYRSLKAYAASIGAVSLQRAAAVHLQERITRSGPGWWTPTGAWHRLLGWSVGFGYKPGRALLWLVVCIGIESFILRWAGSFVKPKDGLVAIHAWPQAVALAVDSMVPFTSLGYQSNFNLLPSGPEQWWFFAIFTLMRVVAWILAALGIAAVTGVIRQE